MLVAVGARETAEQLGAAVAGRKFYVFSIEKLLEYATETEPALILMSARLGGSRCRAVELIPQLHRVNPGCAIVLITEAPSSAMLTEAVRLGAFGTVDMGHQGWAERLQRITAAAARVQHQAGSVWAAAAPVARLH